MDSLFPSRTVDHGFKAQSGQIKDYKLVFVNSPLSMQAVRIKRKDWLAQNQDKVYEFINISTCGLLFH
jgi:hypothetical protein